MKLMHTPGTCTLGIHVLLEEIGKLYELEAVDLRGGAQYRPPFTALNPKSKVPALVRDDGSLLTEFTAIAYWLARANPEAGLWPDDAEAQARALEAWTTWSAPCTCRASNSSPALASSHPIRRTRRR